MWEAFPFALLGVVIVVGLLETVEGAGDRFDAAQPLDAGHPVSARDQKAYRLAVLGLKGAAVHGVER